MACLYPRLTGLETEYGCLIDDQHDLHVVVAKILSRVFGDQRFGLIDVHPRGWDEPPGNGGFLFNGGRLYLDMGHLEYCTPECATVSEAVLYDRAGDQLLQSALEELDLSTSVSFIRNNIDHYTSATFGCHENYLLDRNGPLTEKNLLSLLTFLSLRCLYTGAGRIGGFGPDVELPPGRKIPPKSYQGFQITQRADYVENDFYEWVQGNRAIINTRDEPLADPEKYRRLHLLHGDTNVLPSALFLKLGTTRLALDLLEEDDLPSFRLADAVSTQKTLSYQLDGPWNVQLGDGSTADALAILDAYRDKAEQRFKDRDEETNAILTLWANSLEGLRHDPDSLVGTLDWVSKRFLLQSFAEEQGIPIHDPWIASLDLEYHNICPEKNLAFSLLGDGGNQLPWEHPAEAIHDALLQAPAKSRAALRSRLMAQCQGGPGDYVIDWDSVHSQSGPSSSLSDPFRYE
ncbi:MAG: proteasome accessory factor PafA2 family protein [Verrucomicrobiota bacterium]